MSLSVGAQNMLVRLKTFADLNQGNTFDLVKGTEYRAKHATLKPEQLARAASGRTYGVMRHIVERYYSNEQTAFDDFTEWLASPIDFETEKVYEPIKRFKYRYDIEHLPFTHMWLSSQSAIDVYLRLQKIDAL